MTRTEILRQYKQFRGQGMRAVDALCAAKIKDTWDNLESVGLVRCHFCPDDTPYDDSHIDTWTDVSEERRKRTKNDLWDTIERDGVWGFVAEYRLDRESDRWEHGDDVWGFIGTDAHGYEHDIKESTIQVLVRALKSRCQNCRS